jgi:hypothetical protein
VEENWRGNQDLSETGGRLMFDYKQRPATEEYREGWDRIWSKEDDEEKVEDLETQWSSALINREQI